MSRQPWLWALLAAVCSCPAVSAEPLRVCLENQIKLPEPAEAAMRAELTLLFPRLKMIALNNPCAAASDGQVLIIVKDTESGMPPDALGRAPMVDGKIVPALEVFKGPVARVSGANDLTTLGRALGRVAAHEMLHYLLQQSGHTVTGLLQERLDATSLRSEDRREFVSLIASR